MFGVSPPVERDPLDVVHQHHSRRSDELGELERLDALVVVFAELDARLLQQIDRILRVHVLTVGSIEQRSDTCRVLRVHVLSLSVRKAASRSKFTEQMFTT